MTRIHIIKIIKIYKNYKFSKYLSTSKAVAIPIPEAVPACRYSKSTQSPPAKTPETEV
ncbi:MAG: hypothetical protein NZM02_01850 [Patescibacteria group bacterium]|nr:hypothetical protein [Patescibacteria group bacterium]